MTVPIASAKAVYSKQLFLVPPNVHVLPQIQPKPILSHLLAQYMATMPDSATSALLPRCSLYARRRVAP